LSKVSVANTRSKSKLGSISQVNFGDKRGNEGNDDEWDQKAIVVPLDQLQLSEIEMKQDFQRIINANNPYAPDNVVRFSHKDKFFSQTSSIDHTAFYMSLETNLVLLDSDEGRRCAAAKPAKSTKKSYAEVSVKAAIVPDETKKKAKDADDDDEGAGATQGKSLRNQFNFSERASQTFNQTLKERASQTEPPPRSTFGATATQWAIYDAYVADQARQAALKETSKKKAVKDDVAEKVTADFSEMAGDGGDGFAACSKIVQLAHAKKLERMLCQNRYNDVIQDLFYYEDPSDEYKPGVGSVLPLWRMVCKESKKRAVTALSWCPTYPDLFAVGYGSYDYLRQAGGMIAVFSLKNPLHPEFFFETASGVMCLDFHPKQSDIVAVGLYDGSVALHCLRYQSNVSAALYASSPKTGQHTDPVWQIKWMAGEDEGAGATYSFTSVSSDSKVMLWMVVKNELMHTNLAELQVDSGALSSQTAAVFSKSAGTTMAFSPLVPGQFLVGTEEGPIRLCSTAYGSKYLNTFLGHGMSVYNVVWSVFHPRVFISCGADWTVNLWDSNSTKPIFTYDLGSPVGDVAWSPYSSCVFAAVTTSGSVHVFDLQQNKNEAMCVQTVIKKGHLTHIAFNAKLPLIIVSDDRGAVHNLKLSPNLRKAIKDPKMKTPESQVAVLDKVLDSVKDA